MLATTLCVFYLLFLRIGGMIVRVSWYCYLDLQLLLTYGDPLSMCMMLLVLQR